ncbi:hypothetical protein PS647_01724 [Pseudomonas fluorescens]|uniref:hypothetical protein n=1 Tax=Pseudomonas fluorescens TaxID=294 RepID=UPI001241A267|nr:hypothetical protein [Pseudomonas fluorescens]VVM55913.1 hypothetical protein PS647_01033 [Pseudomonas fluorescens]VVM69649.1 hypothetical protein PS647_01724 [Pseudomonas fluorescens]
MEQFKLEVSANFERSFVATRTSVESTLQQLDSQKEKYSASYFRLVSLQAWRSELLCDLLPSDAEEFFQEAHNDALMSHALARQGAWRVALMSLRSLIENTIFGLYYCDHPVELQQWLNGEHKLGFSETISYLLRHPKLKDLDGSITGIENLKSEYATLSKAVHGSAKAFRMSRDGTVKGLNLNSLADLGAWSTREKATITGLNLLLLCFFADHVKGAALPNLRKSISLAVPVAKHSAIRAALQVTLRH